MTRKEIMKSESSNSAHETGAEPASEARGPDELKRDFLRRFGGYAATAPAALFVLMSPRTSRAIASDGGPY